MSQYYIQKYIFSHQWNWGTTTGEKVLVCLHQSSKPVSSHTFLQFLIVVEALWSQPVLQVGMSKQVVVTQSKIRAERGVVKEHPAELSVRVQTALCRHILFWRSITLAVIIPHFLFWIALHNFLFQNMWLSSQAYKNLFPYMTSASFPAVTTFEK
jgi:hypothetical protein